MSRHQNLIYLCQNSGHILFDLKFRVKILTISKNQYCSIFNFINEILIIPSATGNFFQIWKNIIDPIRNVELALIFYERRHKEIQEGAKYLKRSDSSFDSSHFLNG